VPVKAGAWLSTARAELTKFGTIGLVGYLIDISTFNALRFHNGQGPLLDRPLTAKVISTVIATTWTYFGNRHWTFRHRQRTGFQREYLLFFTLNGIGMAIAVGCLGVSHYLLGWDSPLADNISANVVGLVLGTIFRFWSYRRWVFREHPERPPEHPDFSALTP
jgi:putative flippase GtrA